MARDPLNEDRRRYELMELWIEKVRGFDEMRAWHKDLLSVQKSTEIDWGLALVGVHDNADSMAAAFSLKELVNVLPFVLMVMTTSGPSGDPVVTTAAAPPISCPSTSKSISVDDVVSLIWSNGGEAALAF